jgi:hypothetical protein
LCLATRAEKRIRRAYVHVSILVVLDCVLRRHFTKKSFKFKDISHFNLGSKKQFLPPYID